MGSQSQGRMAAKCCAILMLERHVQAKRPSTAAANVERDRRMSRRRRAPRTAFAAPFGTRGGVAGGLLEVKLCVDGRTSSAGAICMKLFVIRLTWFNSLHLSLLRTRPWCRGSARERAGPLLQPGSAEWKPCSLTCR